MSAGRTFRAVGLVHRDGDGRVLMVRPAAKRAFYLPGGKLEPGESDAEAVRREVREELGVALRPETCRSVTTVTAAAYGEGEGAVVVLACYTGELVGTPTPSAEVAELRYFGLADYEAEAEQAPAVVVLLRELFPDGGRSTARYPMVLRDGREQDGREQDGREQVGADCGPCDADDTLSNNLSRDDAGIQRPPAVAAKDHIE